MKLLELGIKYSGYFNHCKNFYLIYLNFINSNIYNIYTGNSCLNHKYFKSILNSYNIYRTQSFNFYTYFQRSSSSNIFLRCFLISLNFCPISFKLALSFKLTFSFKFDFSIVFITI